MNVPEFQAKWGAATLKERSAAQEHFIDLCHMLGVPTPAQEDKTGDVYAFEKGAAKAGGGQGFADVWWKDRFAWEYKGQHADLKAAYAQLLQYREDLENPPLLVVCDLIRFEVHTNFTGTAKKIHAFTIHELDQPEKLRILRAVFENPDSLKPETTVEAVTEEAAARFGKVAASLDARGHEPHRVAHFLVQMLFSLFAEDVSLLPKGLFTDLLKLTASRPEAFVQQTTELLTAMRDGGIFGLKVVPRFNGGLFADIDPLPLTAADLTGLAEAAGLDWGSVEPAIFGTLFERSLDPSKRSQLGAHYTGRRDIERVVEPVVMMPLRRKWEQVRAEADVLKTAWDAARQNSQHRRKGDAVDRARDAFAAKLHAFQEDLAGVRILDPACGSGNFLYVALSKLLDLEKEVLTYGAANGLSHGYPRVGPQQIFGLEINEYACELAQVVVWIGYLQWMIDNGFPGLRNPVLEPLDTIRLQDALLDLSDPDHPKEATWPKADFIIGNPPFLGGNRVRGELGDEYLEALFATYEGRVPRFADLCCYFFERGRTEIAHDNAQRAGLLATNSIRGGANREVLKRVKETGEIFFAWSDEPWVLDGAAVRISIIGFDDGEEPSRMLDGNIVATINADLTPLVDVTVARPLAENRRLGFEGDKKGGPFELTAEQAAALLALPANPNGRTNADVVRPWLSGHDVTKRPRGMWIIDFPAEMPEDKAALFEAPFGYVERHCRGPRTKFNPSANWWIHERPRPDMRLALSTHDRFICTVRHAKYRLFVWAAKETLPDSALVIFARQDDYFFGVLHSRAHEVWSLRMGTWLGVGNDPRYTPTTCFETFPLPWPPGQEPWRDERLHAIADAARGLDEKRNAWLNPSDATEADLKKRTLTNLYNERPTWLANLHAALDRAVWAAYGWDDPDPASTTDEEILTRLLALNQKRAVLTRP